MSRRIIWAVFGCLVLASAIGAYKIGRSIEAQSNKFAGLASYSQFWLANQPALTSSDDFKVEQALWREVGETEAARRSGIVGSEGSMTIALAYATLSERARMQHAEGRATRLLDEAVASCKDVPSPNCNRDALLAIVRHPAVTLPS